MIQSGNKRKFRRVAGLLVLFGLIGCLTGFFILYQYLHTLPRIPDQITGRIYERDFHGIAVYQTKSEQLRVNILLGVSLIVTVSGIVLAILEEKYWRQEDGHNIPPMPRGWHP